MGIKTTGWLLLPFLLASPAVALPQLICTAVHEDMEEVFVVQGFKLTAAKEALAICSAHAVEEDLDPDFCEVTCEPVIAPF